MRRRFRPKDFAPPRTKRAREAPVSAYEILKDTWPAPGSRVFERPAWAETARKFGWITFAEFYATNRIDTGRRVPDVGELLYAESPFFRILRKEVA